MESRYQLIRASACLAIAMLPGLVTAGGPVQSGPQVGEKIPGPFLPMNVNGSEAGQKSCLYCRNGSHPVAMIFAHEVSPEVVSLITRIEAATAINSQSEMGSCAVFCGDSEELGARLSQLAKQLNLQHLILATFPGAGPTKYKIAPEVDVTVVLYGHRTVKANFSFKKGELTGQRIDEIIAKLPVILSQE